MIGPKLLLERALSGLTPNEMNTALANSRIEFQISANWYRYDGEMLVSESGGRLPPGSGLTQVTAVRVAPAPAPAPAPEDSGSEDSDSGSEDSDSGSEDSEDLKL